MESDGSLPSPPLDPVLIRFNPLLQFQTNASFVATPDFRSSKCLSFFGFCRSSQRNFVAMQGNQS